MDKSHIFGTLAVLVFIVVLASFSGSEGGITGNVVSDVVASGPVAFIGLTILVVILALFITGKDWLPKKSR